MHSYDICENHEWKWEREWKKCEERIASFLTANGKEEKKKKKGRKSDKHPRTRQVLGSLLFLLVLLAQNWLCVKAAAEGLQKRTEIMEWRQHQRFQATECRWAEELPQWWKQPKGEDRSKMKRRGKAVEVHFTKWFSVEHSEEVHEKVRRKV